MKKNIFLYLILIILLLYINVSLAQDISINPNQCDPNNSQEIDPNQNNKYHKVYWFANKKKIATTWLDENDKFVKVTKENEFEKIREMYNDKEVLMEMYNEKGILMSEWNMKNGSGIMKDYYDNGNLKMKQPMQNGKREGITRRYSKGGGIEAEFDFKNDKLDGISKEYYDNGIPNVIENYKNGKLNGIRKIYTKDGKLITAYQYKDGIMTPGVDGYKNFKWGMTKGQILKLGVCDLKNFASGCLLSEKFLRAHPSLESLRGFGEDALICDNFSFGKGQVLAVFYFIDKKLQRIAIDIPKNIEKTILEGLIKKYEYPSSYSPNTDFSSLETLRNQLTSKEASSFIAFNNDTIYLKIYNNIVMGETTLLIYTSTEYDELLEKSQKKSLDNDL